MERPVRHPVFTPYFVRLRIASYLVRSGVLGTSYDPLGDTRTTKIKRSRRAFGG